MKIDDYAKDGGEEFLPRCIAFYNRIPIDSLTILLQTQFDLGNALLAAIFSAIVYCSRARLRLTKDLVIFFLRDENQRYVVPALCTMTFDLNEPFSKISPLWIPKN